MSTDEAIYSVAPKDFSGFVSDVVVFT